MISGAAELPRPGQQGGGISGRGRCDPVRALAEGDLAPVSCLQRNAAPCRQAAECRTLPVWRGYYDMTRQYFSGITLADLMNAPQGDNYVI